MKPEASLKKRKIFLQKLKIFLLNLKDDVKAKIMRMVTWQLFKVIKQLQYLLMGIATLYVDKQIS